MKYLEHDGGWYPTLVCIRCQKPVRDGGQAIWRKTGETKFVHKECGLYVNRKEDGYPYWEPIEVFFFNLLQNTGMTAQVLHENTDFIDLYGERAHREDFE